jgi:hypothetical protein
MVNNLTMPAYLLESGQNACPAALQGLDSFFLARYRSPSWESRGARILMASVMFPFGTLQQSKGTKNAG